MEESVTYQAIIAKGAKKEARKILLALGEQRFGTSAPTEAQTAIDAIDDLPRLEELTRRVSVANNWQDLVQSPPPKKPGPKKGP